MSVYTHYQPHRIGSSLAFGKSFVSCFSRIIVWVREQNSFAHIKY